jgi:hypothetical protein
MSGAGTHRPPKALPALLGLLTLPRARRPPPVQFFCGRMSYSLVASPPTKVYLFMHWVANVSKLYDSPPSFFEDVMASLNHLKKAQSIAEARAPLEWG